jgi:hypothetical protein
MSVKLDECRYYELQFKRHLKQFVLYQSREDKFFIMGLSLFVFISAMAGADFLFNSILAKLLGSMSVAALGWAISHLIQENAAHKNDILDEMQEFEQRLQHSLDNESGLPVGGSHLEYWKEDMYNLIMKVAVVVTTLMILFF